MTIGEVSGKFNISADTLRYYEKVRLIGPIKKNSSGIRNFEENDLRQIEFVKCMRGAGVPVEALVRYMELFEKGDSTLKERRQILVEQREFVEKQISEFKNSFERLNHKIELYDKQILENKLNGIK